MNDPKQSRPSTRGEDAPRAQTQEWPGSDQDLEPRADHGEGRSGLGRLQGRRALVTGGDSGIGRAVATAFAQEGADVAIAYLEEHDDARRVVEAVNEEGRQGFSFPGDLRDPGWCREVVSRAVESLGGLDLLVNNAGVHFEVDDFGEVDDEQLEQVFQTNVLSYFRVTRAALPHLPDEAAIVNTGSVVAFGGHPSLIDYAATKGAVHVFTKSLAQVLAARRIRVNCVAPGPVWTPLIPATRKPEKIEGFGAGTFRDRPAEPAELAPAYVFLASDEARFVTGEILSVTGNQQTSR